MTGGRRARWQLMGVVGQEADYREPDGAGAVGQGGPDCKKGGDGRVHDGQMAVAGGSGGVMGQEFKMAGRLIHLLVQFLRCTQLTYQSIGMIVLIQYE